MGAGGRFAAPGFCGRHRLLRHRQGHRPDPAAARQPRCSARQPDHVRDHLIKPIPSALTTCWRNSALAARSASEAAEPDAPHVDSPAEAAPSADPVAAEALAGTRKSNDAKTVSAQTDTTPTSVPEPKVRPTAAGTKPKPPAKQPDRVRLTKDADGISVLGVRGTVRDQRDIRDRDEFQDSV
jgi:hypothetical protein